MKIAIKLSAVFVCLGVCSGFHQLVLSQTDQNIISDDQIVVEGKKPLKGKIEGNDLFEAEKNKDIENHKDVNLLPGKAEADIPRSKSNYLKGHAQSGDLEPAKEDPDADDKELMIAWDRWRNRFLQAVLGSTTEMLNNDQAHSFQINPSTHTMEAIYPVGTVAWFVCEVTRDRQIKRLRILNSSGYPEYDRSVIEAVQALQDSSLLRFPTGSRRTAVLQGGAVERAIQPQQQYFRFGDVEHYRVPAY